MGSYTLQTSRTGFRGGKNILASEHLQFVEAGATLDAAAIGNTYVEVGSAIGKKANGKWEIYDGEGEYSELGILNIDVEVNGQDDVIVGEVIVRGSVYEAKLPANVTEDFKAATKPLIRYVSHN